MEPFDGKVAWVTGIGRACAVAFARAGARVALTARRLPPLEETAVLTGAPAGDVVIAPADVFDAGAVAAAHAWRRSATRSSSSIPPAAMSSSATGQSRPSFRLGGDDLDLKAMFYCTLAASG